MFRECPLGMHRTLERRLTSTIPALMTGDLVHTLRALQDTPHQRSDFPK